MGEGMVGSTNSLAFRRGPHEIVGGGVGGETYYMTDRDYTVIRAKLMPETDYIPGKPITNAIN